MKPNRIPQTQLTRLDKKNLPLPRAGQQPQAHPSLSKSATASPGLIEQSGISDQTTGPMTKEELISRAKHNIGIGETSRTASFRAAAEDIARACDQGAKQREVAEGVGKSVAWVNRLLKWRKDGYIGAPFADKVVQGVKKEPAALEPPSIEPASPAVLGETNAIALGVQEMVNAAAATAPATMPSVSYTPGDYHLPQELNRQNPEQAFQRLAEQWRSNPFRHLFLDSPRAAQLRFLRDVVLPEVGGPQALELLASGDRSAA